MKKCLSVMLAALLLLTMLPLGMISVSAAGDTPAKEVDLDAVFQESLAWFEKFYNYDAEGKWRVMLDVLYPWEEMKENDGEPKYISEEEFESALNLYFAYTPQDLEEIRALRFHNDEVGERVPFYSPETKQYMLTWSGLGAGGGLDNYTYLGYEKLADGYMLYHGGFSYEYPPVSDDVMWELGGYYNGKQYSYDGYMATWYLETIVPGLRYKVEYNNGIVRILSCEAYTKEDEPVATITKEPTTGYAKMGEKVSVKVAAKGVDLKYEWYVKNAGASKYSKSSVTTATYSTTMSDKAKDRLVYCIVKDAFGNEVKSKTVRLRESVGITKEPATVAYAKKGAKASVKITAKGDGLKYAWYIKNDGASKYSKSSVTSATYSATMGSKVKGRRIYCIVTDKYGKTVQSKTFILREGVSITIQPKTVSVKKNATAKVSVKASGDGLKYTWYIKNAGQTKYSKSSVTSATYSVKMTSKVKNRLVYCVVTDKYGNTVKCTTVKLKMK